MDYTQKTAKYILDIGHQIKINLDSSFDDDINGLQARILGFVAFNDRNGADVYQKDIETEFKIRRSSVSSVLDTMEKNGYIIRQAVQTDARLKKLVLTEKAKQLGIKHRQSIEIFEKNIIKGMSDQEIATLHSLLGKVMQNVEDMRGEIND